MEKNPERLFCRKLKRQHGFKDLQMKDGKGGKPCLYHYHSID
jgi:hypothetical protein